MKLDNDLYVKHLQGMIKYPTVSSVDPEKIDTEAFLAFHKYLEETYPLVHKTMTKEVFGKVGLLYHWKGTGKSDKLPLMLTAHQDVVPMKGLSQKVACGAVVLPTPSATSRRIWMLWKR